MLQLMNKTFSIVVMRLLNTLMVAVLVHASRATKHTIGMALPVAQTTQTHLLTWPLMAGLTLIRRNAMTVMTHIIWMLQKLPLRRLMVMLWSEHANVY